MVSYDAICEKAKGILVFDKTQGKETRLILRSEDPVHVVDCRDHDETILRLAFRAAQSNFNAIVDMSLASRKIKDGSYTTLLWWGQAVPANVDIGRLPKDKSLYHYPN